MKYGDSLSLLRKVSFYAANDPAPFGFPYRSGRQSVATWHGSREDSPPEPEMEVSANI
jgi:hypothetical protein